MTETIDCRGQIVPSRSCCLYACNSATNADDLPCPHVYFSSGSPTNKLEHTGLLRGRAIESSHKRGQYPLVAPGSQMTSCALEKSIPLQRALPSKIALVFGYTSSPVISICPSWSLCPSVGRPPTPRHRVRLALHRRIASATALHPIAHSRPPKVPHGRILSRA